MTREDAIHLLVNATYSEEWQGNEDLTTAHNMAIQALEQQPFINKSCLSEGACKYHTEDVLDEIAKEIALFKDYPTRTAEEKSALRVALQIIDRHRTEGEGENAY